MSVENVCRALKPALSFLDAIHRVRRTIVCISKYDVWLFFKRKSAKFYYECSYFGYYIVKVINEVNWLFT